MRAEKTIDRSDSGRNLQRDDRKMRPFVQIGDLQNQFQVWITDVEFGRSMGNTGVKFNGCFSSDALMRTEFIIPREIESELITHISLPQGNDDLTRAFGFHGADKTLYYGN